MIRRLRDESGTAIITAIALMATMVGVGLAAYSFADTQQTESMRERQRESSFNFGEAVLNTQAFVLSRGWAGSAGAYPDATPTCSSASAPADYCPQVGELTAAFASPDYAAGVEWQTTVWDDAAGPFYDASLVESEAANEHWDANDNNKVWIRAEATVRDRTRAIVALVQVQERVEELPKRTIIAGQFKLTPNGNHVYVQTKPDTTSQHPVTVRCSLSDAGCMEYTPDKKSPQIDPSDAIAGDQYIQGGQPVDALADDVKLRLRERAEADGTLYQGCPADAQLTGKVVWVEGCATANYTQGDWNSAASPGILIWADGELELGGNDTFWGVIYHLNNQNSNGDLVRLRGGLTIQGGVFVDGYGGIDVGSNKINVVYFEDAFTSISSYGTADIVQNSWRELVGN